MKRYHAEIQALSMHMEETQPVLCWVFFYFKSHTSHT